MSSINLVHRYVVEQILSINTKCEFKNYGGTSRGLIDRIMASFHIPETGWLQDLYTNKILNAEKLRRLTTKKFDEDQLEDIVDIWKELCNKTYSESTIMSFARQFEADIRARGFGTKSFLELKVNEWKVVLKTVDNTIKSASDYLEKLINSTTPEEFDEYQEKLFRTLVTYPYIQKAFIEKNYSELLFGQLEHMSNPTLRTSTLITKIKEDNYAHRKEVKAKEAKEGSRKMSEAMKRMHPPVEPYVQFMGTDHLIAPAFKWGPEDTRLAQECSVIGKLMVILSNGDKSVVGDLKALIHRSSNQKALCRDIFILPSDFSNFDSYDRRKRGMILDEILDKVGETPKVQVTKDPLPSFPEYPNLTEEEEHVSQPKVNVPDEQEESTYLKLIKAVHPEVYAIIADTEKVHGKKMTHQQMDALLRNYLTVNPAMKNNSFHYELPEPQREKVVIKGDPSDPVVKKLAEMFSIDINDVEPSETDSPLEPTSSLVVAAINKIVKEFESSPAFKSSAQEPSIKEILESTRPISNLDQVTEMLKNRPTFKSRLTQNLKHRKTGMDNVGEIIEIAKELNASFKALTGIDPSTLNGEYQDPSPAVTDFLNNASLLGNPFAISPRIHAILEERRKSTECDDPTCPVHGKKKVNIIQDLLKTKRPDGEELHEHQRHAVDLIVGIDPANGGMAFVNPDLGKFRSEGQYDFSGLFKFLEDHYGSKPTATEIETSTNVVINQKFVIYDVKGEFFCEYKMTWTPTRTQFTFTHDEPDNKAGRRFYPIRDLNKQMTQDEAFAQFQSLRRVAISDGPHKPKVNPYTGY